jgi:AraC-like DNA-binding protein
MTSVDGIARAMWPNIAQVLLRMQLEVDRDWSLAEAAQVSGYEPHHFAHAFTAVVGTPPAQYVRSLRLERAAAALRGSSASILELAVESGYGSAEAFTRAFRKAWGVAPSEYRERPVELAVSKCPEALPFEAGWPTGLSAPTLGPLPPLLAVTMRLESFDPPAFLPVMTELLTSVPPDGAWQFGCIAHPWGWLDSGFKRDLRAARFVPALSAPMNAPMFPWRSTPDWYASFDYEGPLEAVHPLFEWLMMTWIPGAGLRPAFLPMVSQLHSLGDPARVKARLHAPILALDGGLRLSSTAAEE